MKFLRKSKTSNINVDFSPELSIHHIDSPTASYDVFRVNTRDQWNQTKNIKVLSTDVNKMNIELVGFDIVEGGYIKGEVFIYINESNEGKILLCENCIQVDQNADPIVLKNLISEIWADEFSGALEDYKESLGKNIHNRAKHKKQVSSSKGLAITKDNWVNLICGLTLLLCFSFFAFNYFNKNKQNTAQEEQTILQDVSTAAEEQTNIVNNSVKSNQSISADDEAMQEFGLEKGMTLEVNEN